nr:MAG TPA: hypothetical protein [Caudoviricetes sp.]
MFIFFYLENNENNCFLKKQKNKSCRILYF